MEIVFLSASIAASQRASRAEMLVAMAELSSARQTLEGAELAPGTTETLQMLSDQSRRPPEIGEPLPIEVTNHMLAVPVRVGRQDFLEKCEDSEKKSGRWARAA